MSALAPGSERGTKAVRHAIGKPLDSPSASHASGLDYQRIQTFPGSLDQVRRARDLVAGFLHDCPVADDAVLCVSEFAANAVLHSRSGEDGGRFVVRVEVHAPRYTWVEVEDGGGPWVEKRRKSRLARHGLDIVSKIASEWGVDGDTSGWIPWARLDWPTE